MSQGAGPAPDTGFLLTSSTLIPSSRDRVISPGPGGEKRAMFLNSLLGRH